MVVIFTFAHTLSSRVNINGLKYDEVKFYLSKEDFQEGANTHVRFKLERLTKSFEYDSATSVIYYVDKKDNKKCIVINCSFYNCSF